jgi:hypothetical protein
MVVSAIIALIIGVSYKFYINFENNNTKLTKKQEFVQLEARMLTILRKDLRSSISIDKSLKNRYIIKIAGDKTSNTSIHETIEWIYNKEESKVTRQGNNKRIFDFSKLLPNGKNFTFTIE